MQVAGHKSENSVRHHNRDYTDAQKQILATLLQSTNEHEMGVGADRANQNTVTDLSDVTVRDRRDFKSPAVNCIVCHGIQNKPGIQHHQQRCKHLPELEM